MEVLFFMSYYADLSTREHVNDEEYVMTNIGWIDGLHDFNKGKVSNKFLLLLWEYIKIPINGTRGIYCNILDGNKAFIAKYEGYNITLGSAEIRVIDMENRRIYVSPNLILHYIINHGYCPPQCFMSAVLNGPKPNSEEYKKILISKRNKYNNGRMECVFCGSHNLRFGFSYDPNYIPTENIEILEYTNNIEIQHRNHMFNVICEECGNMFDVPFDEILQGE